VRWLVDPWQNRVALTDERWQHICDHPEVEARLAEVVETVRSPDVIIQSRADERAALFYRRYPGHVRGAPLLCVVVKYGDSASDPFVVTAYYAERRKQGEVLCQP